MPPGLKQKQGSSIKAPCLVLGVGLEPTQPQWPRDFKSLVSTDSTIRARGKLSAKLQTFRSICNSVLPFFSCFIQRNSGLNRNRLIMTFCSISVIIVLWLLVIADTRHAGGNICASVARRQRREVGELLPSKRSDLQEDILVLLRLRAVELHRTTIRRGGADAARLPRVGTRAYDAPV